MKPNYKSKRLENVAWSLFNLLATFYHIVLILFFGTFTVWGFFQAYWLVTGYLPNSCPQLMIYIELAVFIVSGFVSCILAVMHLVLDFFLIDAALKGRRMGMILQTISVLSTSCVCIFGIFQILSSIALDLSLGRGTVCYADSTTLANFLSMFWISLVVFIIFLVIAVPILLCFGACLGACVLLCGFLCPSSPMIKKMKQQLKDPVEAEGLLNSNQNDQEM